jgi:acetyl/propionyl-CoA carboxylase alpha subunit
MFKKILIANRGEIAAVSSRPAGAWASRRWRSIPTPMRGFMAVEMADEAVHIGRHPASESPIWSSTRSSTPCKQTGAEAVHPGFGFLSENPGLPSA